jgi:uncharacterized Zn finger protein
MARNSGWGDPWHQFPQSIPLPVKDGIATSRQHGAMAEAWWSKRFVQVLDNYGLGTRMQRGRRYARSGQLLSFEVQPGRLLTQVQGSRSTPYRVTVDAPRTSEAQWAEVDAALASRVKFAARLLAGDVPPELEDVFAAAGVALLPSRWKDVVARCSCPDSANPCKHIAATLYVFADRLDSDPWLLLEWRGRTREQILGPLMSRVDDALGTDDALGADDAASVETRGPGTGGDVGNVTFEVAPWWPLDPARVRPLAQTGSGGSEAGRLLGVDPPDPPDAVLARLDELDVEIRDVPIADLFSEAYRIVTAEDQP